MKHFETLRGSITPSMARAAADNLHEDQKKVSVASLMIMSVLAVKFMDRGESPQINEMVREAGNQNIFDRRDQIFASPSDNIGERVENELLGRDNRNFYSAVSNETGLSTASVQRLTKWVAAMFAGYVGSRVAKGSTTVASVISDMRSERPEIVRGIPARVASSAGISSSCNRANNAAAAAGSRAVNGNNNSWWIWVIIAVIILLIIIFSVRSCNRKRVVVTDGVVVTESLMPSDTRSGYADNRASRRNRNNRMRSDDNYYVEANRNAMTSMPDDPDFDDRNYDDRNSSTMRDGRGNGTNDADDMRDRRDDMNDMRTGRNNDNMNSAPVTRSAARTSEPAVTVTRNTTQNGVAVTAGSTADNDNSKSVTVRKTSDGADKTAIVVSDNTKNNSSAVTMNDGTVNAAVHGKGSSDKSVSATVDTRSGSNTATVSTSGTNAKSNTSATVTTRSGGSTAAVSTSGTSTKSNASGKSENAMTFVQHRLPDGKVIDVAQGGCEDCMMMYLNSDAYTKATDEELRKHWIQFDNIDFVHGSENELAGNSMAQLENIAQILKAYPDVKIKIGGLADTTGSKAVNYEISRKRAEYIKSVLVKQGIKADRITTEGFGKDLATVPAGSTDAQRAIDRSIAMRFTK